MHTTTATAATCAHCGQRIKRPAATAATAAGSTAGMTTAQLFAHYKRTAPRADLVFFLQGTLSAALRARAECTIPAPATLAALRDAWRSERLAAERAAGILAIGAEPAAMAEGA
jgi:hypothetical protein